MEMREREGEMGMGRRDESLVECSRWFPTPRSNGSDGPQMSMSMSPTWAVSSRESARPSIADTVDLPTPPFPDSTRILWRIVDRRSAMTGKSGSGPLGAVAQLSWFGQPSHPAAVPAEVESVPCHPAPTSATVS